MLQHLLISNYALISHLDITLKEGFTVITGETGAGKSIILGALGLLLGGRSDAKTIKPRAKRCTVEATFDVSDFHLEEFFETHDFDFDGRECIIRREVTDNGKSRAFINDTPTSISTLKQLSSQLIDIHSQHQNLLLNKEGFQLNILDSLSDNQTILKLYQERYQQYMQTARELREFEERVEQERNNMDYLSFQLGEIEAAQLQDGEQETLEEESTFLEHAESIKESLYKADRLLSDDEEGICSKLNALTRTMERLSTVYAKMQPLCERIDSCAIEIEDIASDLATELSRTTFDPKRMDYVTERLNTIYTLQKKHQCNSVKQLINKGETLRKQLAELSDSDETIELLRKKSEEQLNQTVDTATQLSESRQGATKKLEKEMLERLQLLGMPNVRFQAQLSKLSQPTTSGMDSVTFLFSANKNMPLQPLATIASGGEIARVMLSLKAILSSKRAMPTIIFDEIDTGVSGQMAERMGRMMLNMGSEGRQVISITHLPQIAALGKTHYKVYKEENDEAAATHIVELSTDERVTEIAHMLSGTEITAGAKLNAQELLQL
ncbi:MAG: DNA repair protein RecN [Bacteroidaceae bacterium]|nr:DNA repair protein RecN [Bacteroidaceae bacterium]